MRGARKVAVGVLKEPLAAPARRRGRLEAAVPPTPRGFRRRRWTRSSRRAVRFTNKPRPTAQNPSTAERIRSSRSAATARAELALARTSILSVLPCKPTTAWAKLVEFMLYALWGSGQKVGHATLGRRASASPGRTRRSAPACWRPAICGATRRCSSSQDALREGHHRPGRLDFVEAKLRRTRPTPHPAGESRYLVEPNVKEERAACATSTRSSGSPNISTASRMCGRIWSRASSTDEELAAFRRARPSRGPCAAICIS